jgi:hypothetical protein
MTIMSNHLSPTEDPDFYSSILENLKQLSAQLGTPLDEASILEIYQNACDLLSHVSPSPLTKKVLRMKDVRGASPLGRRMKKRKVEPVRWLFSPA